MRKKGLGLIGLLGIGLIGAVTALSPSWSNSQGNDLKVNVERPVRPEAKAQGVDIFVCNKAKDFLPKNGSLHYPIEFLGRKDQFTSSERMEIDVRIPGADFLGKTLGIEVRDERGNTVYETSSQITGENIVYQTADMMGFLNSTSGLGNYVAVAKIDGLVQDQQPFRRVPQNAMKTPGQKAYFTTPGFEIVSSHYARDIQGDGILDDEDFGGVREIFNRNENLTLSAKLSNKDFVGKQFTMQIHTAEGDEVYTTKPVFVTTENIIYPHEGMMGLLPGSGEYIVSGSLNGELMGAQSFEVRHPAREGQLYHHHDRVLGNSRKNICPPVVVEPCQGN